ncbi:hypothetical protein GTU99_11675 [Streptomyces sp. PRKS01-65]|nr:SUKH-4 family immunity protein [Streptomyces harenosi]NEY32844.1 hypothetical protein [Streptomyces harenosi]
MHEGPTGTAGIAGVAGVARTASTGSMGGTGSTGSAGGAGCAGDTGSAGSAAGGIALSGPSLLTMVRFAMAARASGRPPAVPGERGRGEGLPLFWKTAALIGLLVLAAGRRTASGLALDLPARLLEREFGRGEVVRFEEVDFPATLRHEPTRRFLRETGLPEHGFPFRQDTEMPLPTLTEYYAYECPGAFPAERLPARADHLIRVGRLADGSGVVVDAATGTVLAWHESEAALRPLTSDVSALAGTLWLLRQGALLETAAEFEPA